MNLKTHRPWGRSEARDWEEGGDMRSEKKGAGEGGLRSTGAGREKKDMAIKGDKKR